LEAQNEKVKKKNGGTHLVQQGRRKETRAKTIGYPRIQSSSKGVRTKKGKTRKKKERGLFTEGKGK